jgi:hypothetical protein
MIAKTFTCHGTMPLSLITKPGLALNEVKPGVHFARTR